MGRNKNAVHLHNVHRGTRHCTPPYHTQPRHWCKEVLSDLEQPPLQFCYTAINKRFPQTSINILSDLFHRLLDSQLLHLYMWGSLTFWAYSGGEAWNWFSPSSCVVIQCLMQDSMQERRERALWAVISFRWWIRMRLYDAGAWCRGDKQDREIVGLPEVVYGNRFFLSTIVSLL